jgi:hypothetical protein
LSRRFINIANLGLKIPCWLSNVPVRARPYASFLCGHWSKGGSKESGTSVVKYYLILFWKIHFLKANMKYWLEIFPYWREEPKERRSIYKKSLLAILLINIYNNVRNSEHISIIKNI